LILIMEIGNEPKGLGSHFICPSHKFSDFNLGSNSVALANQAVTSTIRGETHWCRLQRWQPKVIPIGVIVDIESSTLVPLA
jgi:hypothetical protein